ncbi:MAG: ABC transporter permease [Acidobacteriota bacterium]
MMPEVQTYRHVFPTRDLLFEWTYRCLQARYKQSILGWFWAVIQPAAQVAIFTLIFTRFVPVDTGKTPYLIFSYVALVPWTLLSTALPEMATSVVDNMALLAKIYFPRETLAIALMLSRLTDCFIAAIVIAVLIMVYQVPAFPLGWLYLPLILTIELTLIIGLGLACAALNVFFRDIKVILVLGLQVWFYASPIIYPISVVPSSLHWIYFLNPMAGVIVALRDVLLEQRLPGPYLVEAGLVSVIVFLGGYWLFKRLEFRFADIV